MLKRISLLLVLGVASVLATYAAFKFLGLGPAAAPSGTAADGSPASPGPGEPAGRARRPLGSSVEALGRLEPRGGVIQIGGLAGDRLTKLLVEEGATVTKGAPLAYLESRGLRLAELAAAESQLDEARAREKVENDYADALLKEAELAVDLVNLQLLDIQAQQEKTKVLLANLSTARADLDRLKALDESIVSGQQLEHQDLVVKQALAEYESAETLLGKLEQSLDLGQQQAEAKLATANAGKARVPATIQAASLQRNVDLAQARLELATVRAPRDARVLKILTREGETIGQKPILQLGDTRQMYVVAEVYEDDVRRVHVGQSATITSNAIGQPVQGSVEHIGVTVSKNEVVSLSPTASTDLRVVDVRIKLKPNDESRRLINLQVDVQIDTRTPPSPVGVEGAAGPQARPRDR